MKQHSASLYNQLFKFIHSAHSPRSMNEPIEFRRSGDGSHLLIATQTFACCQEEAFAFFADASRLEQITPPWLHFRIQTPQPIDIRRGTTIDYRLRLHGVPIRWRTLISEWSPPHRFTDEQLRGPYRQWRHTHEFQTDGANTTVRDRVSYRVPGGRLVERTLVRPQLQRIFAYRQQQLATLLPAQPSN